MPSLHSCCHHLPAWLPRPRSQLPSPPCPLLPHQASTLGSQALSPNIPTKPSVYLCECRERVQAVSHTQGTAPHRPRPHCLLPGTLASLWHLCHQSPPPGGWVGVKSTQSLSTKLHPPNPPTNLQGGCAHPDTGLPSTTSSGLNSKLSSQPLNHTFLCRGLGGLNPFLPTAFLPAMG